MQLQPGTVAHHLDRVERVGQVADRGAGRDDLLANLAQRAEARPVAIVRPLVEPVPLGAADGGDHRPGGVVVHRGAVLARAGDGIERVLVVAVLGQPVEAALPLGRELLRRKQLLAPGQRDQLRLDRVDRRTGHAVRPLDRDHPPDQFLHGLEALLHDRHLTLAPAAFIARNLSGNALSRSFRTGPRSAGP